MNKRYIIAGALIIVGLLLIFGAAGEADFTGNFGREFITRSIIGALLIFVAVPVSGDLDMEGDENNDTRRR